MKLLRTKNISLSRKKAFIAYGRCSACGAALGTSEPQGDFCFNFEHKCPGCGRSCSEIPLHAAPSAAQAPVLSARTRVHQGDDFVLFALELKQVLVHDEDADDVLLQGIDTVFAMLFTPSTGVLTCWRIVDGEVHSFKETTHPFPDNNMSEELSDAYDRSLVVKFVRACIQARCALLPGWVPESDAFRMYRLCDDFAIFALLRFPSLCMLPPAPWGEIPRNLYGVLDTATRGKDLFKTMFIEGGKTLWKALTGRKPAPLNRKGLPELHFVKSFSFASKQYRSAVSKYNGFISLTHTLCSVLSAQQILSIHDILDDISGDTWERITPSQIDHDGASGSISSAEPEQCRFRLNRLAEELTQPVAAAMITASYLDGENPLDQIEDVLHILDEVRTQQPDFNPPQARTILELEHALSKAHEALSTGASGFFYTPSEKRLEGEFCHYRFFLPNDSLTLYKAGETLHNCVGTYGSKVVGKTSLVVLAQNGNGIECAIELKGRTIVQAKSYCNKAPSAQAAAAIREWAAEHELLFPGQKRPAIPFTPGFPDPRVFEHFVQSSHLTSIGYNPQTRSMYIKFSSNTIHRYSDVPEDLFQEFLSAPSKGRFAHAHIYRRFEALRMDEPNQPYRGDEANPAVQMQG